MSAREAAFVDALFALDQQAPDDQRRSFRQSLASLSALAIASPSEGRFEGRDPAKLERGVRAALAAGLFEDLSWIAPEAAAAALYEIANALPPGAEKRDLGRRVLVELYEGSAATFAVIATRMALGSVRGLAGAGIRARVALTLGLPVTADVQIDALALALITRRELVGSFLIEPAVGSLPERRLAARLIERAAMEAAQRTRGGDDGAIRLFEAALEGGPAPAARANPRESRPDRDPIEHAFRTLLADRETLVWRHVASARGLLAAMLPDARRSIEASLAPELSPTEWRRGATSLVASMALDPSAGLAAAMDLLRGPLASRDPGIATAMIWGLPRVIDVEPEAAEELAGAIAQAVPLTIAENLIELRAEAPDFGNAAATRCARELTAAIPAMRAEEDAAALAAGMLRDLAPASRAAELRGLARLGRSLREAIHRALEGFAAVGTREAHARAAHALTIAVELVRALEAIPAEAPRRPEAGGARSSAALLVRDVDTLLLESGVLRNLLLLNKRPSDTNDDVPPIDDIEERLSRWLLAAETAPVALVHSGGSGPAGGPSAPTPPAQAGAVPHAQLHLRQLRALLHLIDAEATDAGDAPERRARIHDRWAGTARKLFQRLASEPASPLRRAVAATIARALDALVRDEVADGADVLLYTALSVAGPADLAVLGEASKHPDVSILITSWARFASVRAGEGGGSEVIRALDAFVAAIPQGSTQRLEGLRGALSRLARALRGVAAAGALRALSDPATSPLALMEDALDRLGQLCDSARRRIGDDLPQSAHPFAPAYPLALAAGRAVQPGADPRAELEPSIVALIERAKGAIPAALASALAAVLPSIASLPVEEIREEEPFLLQPVKRAPAATPSSVGRLPAWIPSRRIIGGFYVHRQLGGGAAGTVFVVTRAEERHDPNAERFALKVPDYDATAARSLSEADFLQLFRQEAGALLEVPEHENLARFVTFDAGARPKPILVMELIEGARCDQLVESRVLSMPVALSILDGVLAGLAAMHAVGVGHLDVKPSNVVLRGGGSTVGARVPQAGPPPRPLSPVLVDFGLAGRRLRPGCATSAYGAPEIWVGAPEGSGDEALSPLAADIYSFGCFAYEVLTGEGLFDGPNDVAMIAAHLTHDGDPPPIARLSNDRETRDIAALLSRCLRKQPRERATAVEARAALARAADKLRGGRWPLPSLSAT